MSAKWIRPGRHPPVSHGWVIVVCQRRVPVEPLYLRRSPAFSRARVHGFLRLRSSGEGCPLLRLAKITKAWMRNVTINSILTNTMRSKSGTKTSRTPGIILGCGPVLQEGRGKQVGRSSSRWRLEVGRAEPGRGTADGGRDAGFLGFQDARRGRRCSAWSFRRLGVGRIDRSVERSPCALVRSPEVALDQATSADRTDRSRSAITNVSANRARSSR